MKFLATVILSIALLGPTGAFATVQMTDPLDELVANCRATHFCNAMATVEKNTSGEDLARTHTCFRDKVRACFYATVLAGAIEGKRSDMLDRTILYGNFCGWRNLARKADGTPPNWSNLTEVVSAIRATPAIDALDEQCKQHDLKYDETPFDICAADATLTQNLTKLSWSRTAALSPEAREVALAFAETIHRNRFTCAAMSIFRKQNW